MAKGDFAAAEPLLREVLKARRETLGNRHPRTLSSINNLGLLLKTFNKGAAAALVCEAMERWCAIERRHWSATKSGRHPSTLGSTDLANIANFAHLTRLFNRADLLGLLEKEEFAAAGRLVLLLHEAMGALTH